jgi:hypothetical protein
MNTQLRARKTEARELFDAFAEDLLAERSERPLLIVAAAKVDDLLLEVLRAFLLPQISNEKRSDELLEQDAPLGTFSARIKMCRRLGLIDPTLYSALERLRILRNLSAHSIAFDAATAPVRDHLSVFTANIAARSSYNLTRQRYFGGSSLKPIEECQCLLLTLCVLLESIHEKVKRTAGNTRTLVIAAK